MEPLLLKAGDVAKLLGLGRSKVFAMLAVGELPVDTIRRTQAAASTGRSEGLRRNRSAWELVEDLRPLRETMLLINRNYVYRRDFPSENLGRRRLSVQN